MKSLKKRGAVTMQHRFPLTAALCSALMLAGCDTEPPTSPDQPAPAPSQSLVPCPVTGFCVTDAASMTVAEPSTLEYASPESWKKLTEVSDLSALSSTSSSTAWGVGDLFAAVGGGAYKVFDNAGNFKEQISDGLGGFTTGCAFNPTLDRLYTTNFSATRVIVYDDASPHSILQNINTGAQSPGGHSESIVFDAAGNFYVGHPDGNDDIHKYDAAGNFITQFNVAIQGRGSDWLDLAADQSTMLYDGESSTIKRFDVVGNTQLADFSNVGSNSFALRLLPPGDGSGGLLVANGVNIQRLDGAGNVAQTYNVTGAGFWFALNLDPNGTSFWAGTTPGNNKIFRFNIASGAVEVGPIVAGPQLFGLCLKGEPTAAVQNIEKELLEGPEQIGIYEPEPTVYVFEINYSGPEALIEDAIPAEFEVTSLNATAGSATSFSNKSKSATHITWDVPAGSHTLTVTIQTRESPGKRNSKKPTAPVFKPTSCGPLPINNGATAFEVNDDGSLVLEEVVDPVTGEVTLEPVVIVGPSNSLGVEAVAGAKECEEG